MDSTNSPNPAADILAALIELELASADATRRIADEAARIIMRDVTDQIGEAIDTMSRLGQTDPVEGAMTTKTLTLPEIAKTWSDRLVRLDGDDIRRLVSDGGILVGADGDQARTDGDAVATVWLRLEDSRIVVCGDADADDWHEADVELPSTISRVWHLGDLREQMGSEATIEDADEMRDLLADAGWLHWTSDADGGLMIDIPEDEWLALLEVACARAAESADPNR